ncbi:EAL domain-containing protein [Paraburkholderia fynbosensis]|uniref:cyclic-guanylate-specific phosphodiesterase n=1 Tax=Paraburkholderia fynbosensis TaxID=1200993 RepID=A0A6J5H039_9BURK|nr:EAL domain-containing protein [Paraburkholderia fynbosensis]CAB3809835.1 putative cyclic di-GMP phosphodiesterase PdeN [Paraburkholderia fynbosensis]
MSDTTGATTKSTLASQAQSANVFQGKVPRLLLFLCVVCGVSVMLVALMLGEHLANVAITGREELIGDDLVASIDRILDSVSSRRRTELAALAGKSCRQARASLAELQTQLRYVRAVALVSDGHLYCSSALGPIDVPLLAYPFSTGGGDRIGLLAQTRYQPGAPVLVMFDRTAAGAGVLSIVEGDYLADALAHGVRYGAQTAAMSVTGAGLLNDHGTFLPAAAPQATYTTRVASRARPFAILVSSSGAFISGMHWKYRLAGLAIGLLIDSLNAAVYLLAFAPRRLLLNAVRQALRREEFHVVYQPIIETTSREPVGVEALLRWHHPKWGAISPASFIAEVESSEMLAPVTEFVLRTAVAEMSRRPPAIPLRIAVNVAPGDLERKGFVAQVESVSDGLPPGVSLVLELTERFLLGESVRTAITFKTLRAKGVSFAIDDFGTHHSNLELLGRFQFDFVKIDRQFVNQANAGGADLISGIVSVAKHFGLQVIAEGVETEAQHQALLAAGVPFAQGYLYQRPVRAEQLASPTT